MKQIIHGKAENTTILYVFASSFKETLFWFGKQLHLINFVWLFEHSQHEKGPKQMTQFKRCYCIIWHLIVIVPNKSFTKNCCYIASMEHQMVGYFAKFTSLVLATCLCGIAKSTFPYFTEFHLHFAKLPLLPNCKSQHYPIPSVVYLYNANLS